LVDLSILDHRLFVQNKDDLEMTGLDHQDCESAHAWSRPAGPAVEQTSDLLGHLGEIVVARAMGRSRGVGVPRLALVSRLCAKASAVERRRRIARLLVACA
jgi:hypothetical protein